MPENFLRLTDVVYLIKMKALFAEEFKKEFWKNNKVSELTQKELADAIYKSEYALGCVGYHVKPQKTEEESEEAVQVIDRILMRAGKYIEHIRYFYRLINMTPIHELLHYYGLHNERLVKHLTDILYTLGDADDWTDSDFDKYFEAQQEILETEDLKTPITITL